MNFKIKTFNEVYNINIDNKKTILYLKYSIKELLNIDTTKQRLIFQGYPLVDEKTLEYYNIQEYNTIFLVKTI
jgi:hypothetical protein